MFAISIHELWPALLGLVIGASVLAVGRLISPRRRPVPVRRRTTMVVTDPFGERSVHEQRAWVRRKGNAVTVLLAEETKSTAQRGHVIDRSPAGLGLLVSKPVLPGTALRVRPANADAMVPWSSVVVKSCCEASGEWRLGCQFAPAPPWSILLLFG
jgi:hypothetical protein